MSVPPGVRALVAGVVVVTALAACSQGASPAVGTTPEATSSVEGAKPIVTGVEGHFNPTEAVGGGANASNTLSDVASVFASVPQTSQLKLSANASPPGATGADVTSVSVIGQDTVGLLKGLDAASKNSLGEAILTAAAEAWPNASISVLISGQTGGQIIASRPKGGPNMVIAS